MEEKSWTFVDKKGWPPGPWDHEPDKMQFTDPDTGLPCLIHRNPGGALCGYVGVPEGHPFYGINYSHCSLPTAKERGPQEGDETLGGMKMPDRMLEKRRSKKLCEEGDYCKHTPESSMDVHGGLTFSDFCGEMSADGHGICHVPGPGEPDKVWWFGFDCSHLGDRSPGFEHSLLRDYGVYRKVQYVKRECARLAAQLATLKK